MYLNAIDISEGPMDMPMGKVQMIGLSFHFSLEKNPGKGAEKEAAGHKTAFLAVRKGVEFRSVIDGIRDFADKLENGVINIDKTIKTEVGVEPE